LKSTDLLIEYINIDALTPCANNSKIHTKAQVEHIANSIREFGFNDPLAVAGKSNVVLEGNGRIEAAKKVGLTALPCMRLDHLSPDEQRAYIIAHNALNLETGFDDGVLYAELEALKKYDFSDFGLDAEKYMATLDGLQKKALAPIQKAHYLISVDVNRNDGIMDLIVKLRNMEGVEVRAACN